MNKINLAFAGFRHTHIYTLYDLSVQNPNINIIGAWEEHIPSREEAEKKHGIKFSYNAFSDILNDSSVDAVAIGSCYGDRGHMIIEALRAGKHVISDKPLCTLTGELNIISELARDKHLQVGMMLDLRYNKNVLAAKRLIAENHIGEVNNIYFGGQHPLLYGTRPAWYFEKGKHGGVINDISVHGIDLIKFLTGLVPDGILASRCWNKYAAVEKDFKDSGQFMLRLNNNAGVIADVSYAMPDSMGYDSEYYWDFKIWGTGGMISFGINSDGVKLFQNGFTEPKTVYGETVSGDCLSSFVKRIAENEAFDGATAEVLAAAEYTLAIQEKSEQVRE